ncbi:MAG: hypothetical protein QNJ55_30360 [Xenococcus sp. MO_188.B8]|nr:hypothetical protein [Xenococcus sp. MO_188.B8]
MTRIILGSYMVRYPLGGMMSWVLQYLVGFQQLGHEVYFVEKAGYPNACYNPEQEGIISDDCTYGFKIVQSLLARVGLDQLCFVDAEGEYYGLSQAEINAAFRSADLFVDMGTHGSWLEEAQNTNLRVLIDGEPGFTQMKMVNKLEADEVLPKYDFYYTTGQNIGTNKSSAPTAGKSWRAIFHPVATELFSSQPSNDKMPFTTIMNWQSYEPLNYQGTTYGHKDLEFKKFLNLAHLTEVPLELAVAGTQVPFKDLRDAGWQLRDAHDVTISFDSFRDYIQNSQGEFSVCKNGFVATNSGWFSDRSAAYLASSRPVVMQDTGFSDYLPCGEGLFAVRTVEEAAAAIDAIAGNYKQHSKAARDIAIEYLEAKKVLGKFLNELGI